MVLHIESLKEQAWKSFLHLVPLSFPCFLLPCLLCVCLFGLSGFTHSAAVLCPSILLKLHCQQNVASHPCNSSTWEVEAEKLEVQGHVLSQIVFKPDLCYVRHCHKRRRGCPPSAMARSGKDQLTMKCLCKMIISPAHETFSHSFLFPAKCPVSRTNYSGMADKNPRVFTLS